MSLRRHRVPTSILVLVLFGAAAWSPLVLAASFNANAGTLGTIPDGTMTSGGNFGPPQVVMFTASGMGGTLTGVSLSISATHTWVGDLDVVLTSPGSVHSLVIFSRTGATTATGVGDSTDLASGNSLTFADTASTNWWTTATTLGDTGTMPAGSYRTTQAGGAGQVNPAPVTSLDTTFSGLTAAQMNGTWLLAFRDGASGDTGSVTGAQLTLTSTVTAATRPVDFTGDSRSDPAIVRNTGGGPSGQITWWTGDITSGASSTQAWGLATDFFTPGDFDGDGKTDLAVWRPGVAGVAAFWILRSSDGGFDVVPFGQTGDDPTVIGDYDGDGKTDLAVYRAGASAGEQSTWYYKSSLTGTLVYVPWGLNGDFPAPGDYDGDGKADFAIQRNGGGGQAAFWINQTSGGVSVIIFGTPTDLIVPGDYDGDGRTDLAVSRGVSGSIDWYYRRSSDGVIVQQTFGLSSTDSLTQGDYDGDGRTDLAIWRPSATPGQSAFWVAKSSGGIIFRQWGLNGDYPVANFNVH